ncbi:hypothetical protein [Deinococcus sp. DB0503]|uniref:hypothetical protein n=1 Tax=Deinococcus sp. DB0503 TaxID=2479203 RepID=UPI0018DF2B62|nr:hypothetical protein [Deinococcus sp. DB0503]MBI0446998.1 hypothetical protein [Deinococcus sp. DB0503]
MIQRLNISQRSTALCACLGVSPLTALTWLVILAAAVLLSVAFAQQAGSNPFDTTFQQQGKTGCGWIASFVSSILVRIVFFGMAVIGFVMGLARMRGGWGWCALGIVGGILSLEAIPLAKNLGIVPPQCGL